MRMMLLPILRKRVLRCVLATIVHSRLHSGSDTILVCVFLLRCITQKKRCSTVLQCCTRCCRTDGRSVLYRYVVGVSFHCGCCVCTAVFECGYFCFKSI